MRSIRWTDIEILTEARGKPFFVLHGLALRTATNKSISSLLLSLTHTPQVAVAYVLAVGR